MTSAAAERDGEAAAPLIEVVLPVRNRGPEFAEDVACLHAALAAAPGAFRLVIADAGSTDGSWLVARRLAAELPEVYAQQVPARGGPAAVRQVWEASDADVVADLRVPPYAGRRDVLPGLADLLSGRIDVSVGAGYLAVRTVIAQALLSDMSGRIRRFESALVAAAARHGLRIQRSSRWRPRYRWWRQRRWRH
ncbi:glycosyltransferase family 2 protein [Fodinicola acaciae]|uniref:glycosyltransferase family 2 protein n=1 Tax=Fodinicola acaciae TaxID=2681555 RepID=UPI0013D637BA|nr:glycosyltransferase family 2 protein [Fodinicola acaciae]